MVKVLHDDTNKSLVNLRIFGDCLIVVGVSWETERRLTYCTVYSIIDYPCTKVKIIISNNSVRKKTMRRLKEMETLKFMFFF